MNSTLGESDGTLTYMDFMTALLHKPAFIVALLLLLNELFFRYELWRVVSDRLRFSTEKQRKIVTLKAEIEELRKKAAAVNSISTFAEYTIINRQIEKKKKVIRMMFLFNRYSTVLFSLFLGVGFVRAERCYKQDREQGFFINSPGGCPPDSEGTKWLELLLLLCLLMGVFRIQLNSSRISFR